MFRKKHIYFDYASTTPLDKRVARVMKEADTVYGNPSSIHTHGVRARNLVRASREKIARLFQVTPEQVLFTSGGTESNNIAIQGVVSAYEGVGVPHIITSTIEHPAVLEVCRHLEQTGKAEVTYVEVTEDGCVSVEDIQQAIKNTTVLVSVMLVNNEIGTIQPLRDISRVVTKWRKENDTTYPYIHTDASQAPCYVDCNVERLGVDLMTIDGLKIYGPKGIGLLVKKNTVSLAPIMYGGGQERGMRSGTEHVSGIAGLAEALHIASDEREGEVERISRLRDFIVETVLGHFGDATLNGDQKERIANNVNICFPGVDAEFLVILLDQKGFSTSFSSSCRTKAETSTSYVIEALHTTHCAQASVRITLGRYTTKRDVQQLIQALKECVPKALRA